MSTFKSPAMSRTWSAGSTPAKPLVVSDEPELDPAQWEQQRLEDLKQAKLNQKVSLTGRERIEYLLNIGRKYREVEVDGIVFTLQTLKSKELQTIIEAQMQSENKDNAIITFLESRALTLALAVTKIDGESFGAVLGSEDLNVKFNFLNEMSNDVLNLLHQSYLDLSEENQKKFSLNTVEDSKEVIADIKK